MEQMDGLDIPASIVNLCGNKTINMDGLDIPASIVNLCGNKTINKAWSGICISTQHHPNIDKVRK